MTTQVQGMTVTKTGQQGAFGGEEARVGQAPPAVPPPLAGSGVQTLRGGGVPAKPGHAKQV
jgi:hypothetical protein